jgi:peptidoglycan/xylan/chitin deacetylase (PgdA/CDA1 family)
VKAHLANHRSVEATDLIILNYHGVIDGPDPDRWTLRSPQFDAHLDEVRFRLIAPDTFLTRCQDPAHEASEAVLLTFDDACVSDYTHAYPRLGHASGPGFISFVPVEWVGQKGRMSWAMIREMHCNGITFGSHGLSHIDLTSLQSRKLKQELEASKRTLEDRLGSTANLLAFPFGRFSKPVCDMALEVGYTHLFTIRLGYHNGFEPFLFSRLCITNAMDAVYIQQHIANPNRARNLAWRISSQMRLYRPLMRMRFGWKPW